MCVDVSLGPCSRKEGSGVQYLSNVQHWKGFPLTLLGCPAGEDLCIRWAWRLSDNRYPSGGQGHHGEQAKESLETERKNTYFFLNGVITFLVVWFLCCLFASVLSSSSLSLLADYLIAKIICSCKGCFHWWCLAWGWNSFKYMKTLVFMVVSNLCLFLHFDTGSLVWIYFQFSKTNWYNEHSFRTLVLHHNQTV